jgi:hypothetical protein
MLGVKLVNFLMRSWLFLFWFCFWQFLGGLFLLLVCFFRYNFQYFLEQLFSVIGNLDQQPLVVYLGHLPVGCCDHGFCDLNSFALYFSNSCAHSSRLVKHWPIAGTVTAGNQTVTHHRVTWVLFFTRTCVPRVPNMTNYIFSTHLQLSNGSDWPCSKKQSLISVALH